jgi:hypothetical protein
MDHKRWAVATGWTEYEIEKVTLPRSQQKCRLHPLIYTLL